MPITLARPSGRTALLGLGVVTGVSLPWACWHAGSWVGQQVVWPLLGALLLELWAVPLPGFGVFSLATPFYLAMILRPEVGVLPPLVLAYAAALVRAALTRGTLAEALSQASPVLAAALTAQLLGPYLSPTWVLWLGCAQAGLAAAWQVPRLVAPTLLSDDRLACWERTHARTALGLTALAVAGLVLAAVPNPGPMQLLAIPIVLALRQSMRAAISAEQQREAELLQSRLSWAREERDQALQAEQSTRQELALLEELARALARDPDPFEIMDRILAIALKLYPCQSAVLFGPSEGRLVPIRVIGPHAPRLAAANLLALSEPVVDAAWRSGLPQFTDPQPGQPRLLPGEYATALPMGPVGVLYVGDSRAPADPEVLSQLRMLAAYGQLGLRCGHYFRSQQLSLEQFAQANERLRLWGAGLAQALEGVQALASMLDPQAVEARLCQSVAAVVPHDRLHVLWPDRPPPPDLPAPFLEVSRVVLESGRPLLFEELVGSRFQDPESSLRSLLAVPLPQLDGPCAVIFVGARQPGQFSRYHQDLLGVLAYQAGAAYHSARVHQSLAEAYRRLQESEAQLVSSARNAAIGQLAAGVAHELNTPLGSIVLGLETATRSLATKPERVERMLERAVRSAEKAQAIVARLLFYSREGTVTTEEFDLNEVVTDTLGFVGHQMQECGVTLESALHPQPALTRGSASAVQQILLNLLFNARDAVLLPEAAARHIRVATHTNSQQVALSVSDRGPGLAPELWERAFEPFFTTKPVGHGTGLGLYTSRQLATQARGTLEVQSPPGQGATFILKLPVAGG